MQHDGDAGLETRMQSDQLGLGPGHVLDVPLGEGQERDVVPIRPGAADAAEKMASNARSLVEQRAESVAPRRRVVDLPNVLEKFLPRTDRMFGPALASRH